MTVIEVDDQIKELQKKIGITQREVHRMEGILSVFLQFKEAGINKIPIPSQELETINDDNTHE